jgi:predicted nucleic acid-binding protein
MRLIDSDVIIWNWRSQEAAATLLAAEPFAISAVTYMELVQGMRNARELKNLQADLALWQVTILPITKAISERASRLVEEHFLKGTSKPALDKLVATLQASVQDPTFKSRLAELGAEPVPVSKANPESLRTQLKAEIDKWGPVIKKAGVYAD